MGVTVASSPRPPRPPISGTAPAEVVCRSHFRVGVGVFLQAGGCVGAGRDGVGGGGGGVGQGASMLGVCVMDDADAGAVAAPAEVVVGAAAPAPPASDKNSDDDEAATTLGSLMDDMFDACIEFAPRTVVYDRSLLARRQPDDDAAADGDGGAAGDTSATAAPPTPSSSLPVPPSPPQRLAVTFSASLAACTDAHLTGQIPWPVQHLLNWYLLAHPHRFAGKRVVELGAGVGLSGLVLGEMGVAERVLITDGQDEVMPNLRQNGAAASARGVAGVSVARLRWESDADKAAAVAKLGGRVDVVIGADILAYTLGVPKLPLECGRDLLLASEAHVDRKDDDACMLIAYHTRFGTVHLDGVRAAADELGMVMEELDLSFLPQPPPPPLDIFRPGEVMLLRFCLAVKSHPKV